MRRNLGTGDFRRFVRGEATARGGEERAVALIGAQRSEALGFQDRVRAEDPYRPRRARGMGDNDTGRLPEPVQAEIREAALEAILAWRRGRPAAIPEPCLCWGGGA